MEPIEHLEKQGFEVTYLPMDETGVVKAADVRDALRDDTLLVSVMHANNETGMIQPITEVADIIEAHPALLHTDAAQTFGKLIAPLQDPRIDLISISGHKLYAPKGVGCLIARNTNRARKHLTPLVWGGGQEGGLRPGTSPVHLIAALGRSVELAEAEHHERLNQCTLIRDELILSLSKCNPIIHGKGPHRLHNTLCFALPPYDADALILALKDDISISTGSACTSHSFSLSHVLSAMCIDEQHCEMSIRVSWSHNTGIDEISNVKWNMLTNNT